MEPAVLGGASADNWSAGISSNSEAPAAFGSSVNRGTGDPNVAVAGQSEAYVSGSFERVRFFTLQANQGNSTDYRSICMGCSTSSGSSLIAAFQNSTFVVVFDEVQTKDDEHLLTIRFRLSWGRDLS
jgi:hypothetical protein